MIERAYRPQVVRPIKISGKPIRADLQLETFGYILATLILLSMGTLLVLLFEPTGECDLVTAASANLATFCTTGPGFGRVGPISNFGWMTNASKLVLCAVMLLGRLELFAIIVLFSPRFWRTE
jgi:trk system potassium uptake protein TrkH